MIMDDILMAKQIYKRDNKVYPTKLRINKKAAEEIGKQIKSAFPKDFPEAPNITGGTIYGMTVSVIDSDNLFQLDV